MGAWTCRRDKGGDGMSGIGYTKRQADRLQEQLDKDMARIEDAAITMRHRVPDTSEGVEEPLERLREVYHSLWATVERRRR